MHLRLLNTSTYGVLFQVVVVLVCLFFCVFFVGLRLAQASSVSTPPLRTDKRALPSHMPQNQIAVVSGISTFKYGKKSENIFEKKTPNEHQREKIATWRNSC